MIKNETFYELGLLFNNVEVKGNSRKIKKIKSYCF